ncbi:aryl-alcohol dehydrogenase-like predicted oxidoreductase [Paenibacillus sp. V4I3]|uniref:aldo/keto reductase n=1 Tax=unclassified Paenibacillus TaxID=185978 RepID=UPI00277D33C1|nr:MULTISPECIES: aldo/keto reductase [unclassified Paenibacillus]MDQ0878795.1 aryl-alcohol dehydrogenase-like predicted oxidoreductase [Paenibacillus sp. V4I3]MDQ0885353.1 aryl-alcohol dehydrogenase-like predicted oxidoreductase [Paenibacillus sp. V4I9]
MQYKSYGSENSSVSAIGLGLMGMSDLYGQSDRVESIATIHEALEQGVTLFDTGDFYGSGHNELLLSEALQGQKRDKAYISVKFGALRTPDGGWGGFDARPESIKNFLAYSLKRLNVEYIDLYQPARVDPNVPIEEVVGAIADMVKAGYVRHIGLSEAGADTIRRAHAVHPITSLQIEYSLFSRGIEEKILPTLRELGISLTAYGVLSRGLLSGTWSKERNLSPYDFRGYVPRFQGENLDKNLSLVEALREIAEEKQVTVAQLAIAWVLSQGEDIVPIIGARRRTYLRDALGALNVNLAPKDLEAIQAAIPQAAVSGDRYYAEEMAHLDSEK